MTEAETTPPVGKTETQTQSLRRDVRRTHAGTGHDPWPAGDVKHRIRPMTDHDAGYRALFSDKIVVADLIRGFIKQPWIDSVDLKV